MEKFTKTTVGFVTQTFERNAKGRFVCTHQEFIASDQCDYEDPKGNPIEPPEHEYQPYDITLRNETEQEALEANMLNRVYEAIEEVLESLDVGGEQSRQFAEEIQTLRQVIGHPKAVDGGLGETSRRRWMVQKLRRLAVEAEGLTASLPALHVGAGPGSPMEDDGVRAECEPYDLAPVVGNDKVSNDLSSNDDAVF